MGKVVSRREPNGWRYRAVLGLSAAALLLGCASGAKTPAGGSSEPPATASAQPQAAPAQITALDVREAAPGVRLELKSTSPLVWTQYRDSEGRLVLELPNSTPAAGVSDLGPTGVLQSVTVRQVDGGERPLTRLVIATKGETEHE